MVRFLRNATVAKIAGKDSSLLQISSEERERVARVAELFGEEDLTRHLQIMLRTHSELGYKQEQRFHLELGLLKMAHAQKLLPIEQLLSEVANTTKSGGGPAAAKPASRPTIVSQPEAASRKPEAPRQNFVSPFAADSARKGTPRQEDSLSSTPAPGPRIVATSMQSEPVIMGSAAPAQAPIPVPISDPVSDRRDVAHNVSVDAVSEAERQHQLLSEPASQPQANATTASAPDIERLQTGVLQALADNNQRILVAMLSDGHWSVEGNEVVIKIAESQTIIDMSLSADAKRLAIAAASGVLGRPVKLKVIPGANVSPPEKKNGTPKFAPGPGGRGRAEQDPVVRRMQEKFGAEIRTVIDYRDKR
jgi:DNA polymerase-3 subunit gamma/tau